jgi:hypothetical protein
MAGLTRPSRSAQCRDGWPGRARPWRARNNSTGGHATTARAGTQQQHESKFRAAGINSAIMPERDVKTGLRRRTAHWILMRCGVANRVPRTVSSQIAHRRVLFPRAKNSARSSIGDATSDGAASDAPIPTRHQLQPTGRQYIQVRNILDHNHNLDRNRNKVRDTPRQFCNRPADSPPCFRAHTCIGCS